MADETQDKMANAPGQSGQTVHGQQVNIGDIEGQIGHIGDQISGDQILNIFDGAKIDPPSRATIEHFLVNSITTGLIDQGNEDAAIQFWDTPIRYHVPGDLDTNNAEKNDLFDTVSTTLQRDLECGRITRLKILGDPGAGKSAALNYLQNKQAQQSWDRFMQAGDGSLENVTLPLFISLAHLQLGTPFKALIRDAFNRLVNPDPGNEIVNEITTAQVDAMLYADYRILFLFDGLEDLFSAPPERGLQVITTFMADHPRHFYVLTCSTAAHRGQLGASEDIIVLDNLLDADVRAILDERNIRQLNPSLLPLLRNRALLKILLNLVSKDSSLEHIRSKGQLLRELSRRRLGFEEFTWSSEAPNPDMLELFLEELAFNMTRNHAHSFSEYELMLFIQEYLLEWHEPYSWRQVADFLRNDAGILKRDQLRRWSFRFKTTIAYFAAAALLKQPDRVDLILDDLKGIWWHDSLALLIGLQPEPMELCYRLIDRDVFVAAYCVRFSGRDVDNRVIDALVDTLIEKMAQENSRRRRRIVMQIGESGHPRAIDALLLALQRDWSSYVIEGIVRAIAVWVDYYDIEALENQMREQIDDNAASLMLRLCIDQLVRPSGDEFSVDEIQKIIDSQELTPLAQGLAALALGFRQEPECRDVLIELLRSSHTNKFVAWCGAEALALYADDDFVAGAAQEILGQMGEQKDPADSARRARAAYLLGWIGGNAQANDILLETLEDEDPGVVIFAIDAIVRLQLINAHEIVEALLRSERDPRVERKIVESLGEIGDVNSIAVLERFLLGESARTRWVAQNAIMEIRHRHELEQVAGHDGRAVND